MIKKLLILIAVIALLSSFPASRSKLTTVAAPLLGKLGPVGERIAAPARQYNARTACTTYLRIIAERYNEGHEPPTPREFPRWAQQQTGEDALDPWGNSYWLVRERGVLRVGSNGVDGRRGTSDDIPESVPF